MLTLPPKKMFTLWPKVEVEMKKKKKEKNRPRVGLNHQPFG